MMYPLVRDFGATGAPVAGTCRILDFSRQAFYYWCANQVSARDWDEAHLIRVPTTFIRTTLSSGTGFINDEFQAVGYQASERRVWRLCSQQEVFSHTIKRTRERNLPRSLPCTGRCPCRVVWPPHPPWSGLLQR